MSERASTQHYLNVADIRDSVLILRNGELRQMVEVEALNFALKSEQEQAAIVYQYQAFLNGLQFPVQIVIQSRRLDLTKYIVNLKGRMDQTSSPLLKIQIADYIDFVSRLTSLGNIMEKRFFVIVPYADPHIRGRSFFGQLLKQETVRIEDKAFAEAKNKLAERVEVVRSGLTTLGLTAAVLTNETIIKLLYTTYNPPEAGEVAIETPSPQSA